MRTKRSRQRPTARASALTFRNNIMPFTLSHPAAVIPFYKATNHPLFLLAVVVGSVSRYEPRRSVTK